MASCASVHRYLNSCRYFSALSFLVFSTLKPALLSALSLLGNCETYDSKIAVVRNRQIVSRVLGSRRCLDAVFWRLMHRCERQCSESVPCGDCLFCTTGTFENRVSQLPIIIVCIGQPLPFFRGVCRGIRLLYGSRFPYGFYRYFFRNRHFRCQECFRSLDLPAGKLHSHL